VKLEEEGYQLSLLPADQLASWLLFADENKQQCKKVQLWWQQFLLIFLRTNVQKIV